PRPGAHRRRHAPTAVEQRTPARVAGGLGRGDTHRSALVACSGTGNSVLHPSSHRPRTPERERPPGRSNKHVARGPLAANRPALPRRCPAGLFRPRPQALAHDRGQQDAAVGDDEHPVVEHHAVGDEADRGQALADEQPARDAGAGAVDDLLADLPHQGGEQDRGRGPADPVGTHAPLPRARGTAGSCACACAAAAAAWPTATAIWLRPPTMSPMAYSPAVSVCWWRSTTISPPPVRVSARPSVGTVVVKPRKE